MNLSNYKPRASDDGTILFPLLECWNPITKVATIAAEVNGKRVLCRISSTVLKKKFGSSADTAMKAITDNRLQIETAAIKLIENEAYEQDGSIAIQYKDFTGALPEHSAPVAVP